MSENYMDRYSSPEEFFRGEILACRHGGCIVTSRMMIDKLIPKVGRINFNRLRKAQLFDLLLEHYGDEVYTMFPDVGVYAVSFQKKFGLTRAEVEQLAEAGVITVTGQKALKGGVPYKVFSAKDYFRLSWGKVVYELVKIRNAEKEIAAPVSALEVLGG